MKNKIIDKKKLLIYSAAAIASGMALMLIALPAFVREEKISLGFDTNIPEGTEPESARTKSEIYEATITDTIQLRDTVPVTDTVVVMMQKSLSDFTAPATKPAAKPKPKKRAPAVPKDTVVKVRRGFIDAKTSRQTKSSIQACIHQDQKIEDGGRVRIRTIEDAQIDGHTIKSGTILSGTARISGSRIKIEVNSVRTEDGIRQIRLQVFDSDSNEGIFYPELKEEKAARNTGGNLSRKLASSLGRGSDLAGVLIDGGGDYIAEKIENVTIKLHGDYRITLQKI